MHLNEFGVTFLFVFMSNGISKFFTGKDIVVFQKINRNNWMMMNRNILYYIREVRYFHIFMSELISSSVSHRFYYLLKKINNLIN